MEDWEDVMAFLVYFVVGFIQWVGGKEGIGERVDDVVEGCRGGVEFFVFSQFYQFVFVQGVGQVVLFIKYEEVVFGVVLY